ncbi:hypothetical protein DEO72_LG6g773 [Vigna unguiculata]|uniref:Uncharacterized protein n=1 Tax=Vigna unguiculata TaxID=3917 RepID=A0A4D6M6M8_VIGUN|nr:hypothetical protein DEO72_LG6g773 [Vigna unguiculata]
MAAHPLLTVAAARRTQPPLHHRRKRQSPIARPAARTCISRATVNQPPRLLHRASVAQSSRLLLPPSSQSHHEFCCVVFSVHLVVTTMVAPLALASLPMSCPQLAGNTARTIDNTRTNAHQHLCSRLILFLATSTMETTVYSVQFHQHRSAAECAPPLVARTRSTTLTLSSSQ